MKVYDDAERGRVVLDLTYDEAYHMGSFIEFAARDGSKWTAEMTHGVRYLQSYDEQKDLTRPARGMLTVARAGLLMHNLAAEAHFTAMAVTVEALEDAIDEADDAEQS